MFSFHKPKVYRSSTGCCICKAKSSSSRFTDSKKYEEDFMKCFQLEERRTGEICNACVLLVKRWKKLPVGSSRNWRHVVDARAGPGIKSLTKFKAKNKKKPKEALEKIEKVLKKKQLYPKHGGDREDSPAMSDDSIEENIAGNRSKSSSRAGSPMSSDDNGVGEKRLSIAQRDMDISDFIDLTYFKRKNVCCGVIFVGMMGEVLVEPSFYKPCLSCQARRERQRQQRAASVTTTLTSATASSSPAHSSASASPCHSSASASPAHSVDCMTGVASDGKADFGGSSSDSGYDDSSNHSSLIGESKKPPQPPPPSSGLTTPSTVLQLLTKPGKAQILKAQQLPKSEHTQSLTTALRLKGFNSGTKVPIKLLCKPVALVSSAKLSLAGSSPVSSNSVLAVPSAVDFAVRPPPQRPSLAN